MSTEPECHFGWVYCVSGIAAGVCGWFIDSFVTALGCAWAIGVAAIWVEIHWSIRGRVGG